MTSPLSNLRFAGCAILLLELAYKSKIQFLVGKKAFELLVVAFRGNVTSNLLWDYGLNLYLVSGGFCRVGLSCQLY